ncbi:NADPH-dependent 2,4-dienoyl-CoA reductase, sulfur reductase [Modicisalibacter ilicicola DSM 19980]|uniref:NADPH-dependent 2,4-dienoyl-CoA reductase, sulfur reductase n=1 Tax=Modicisalibacter ilicicola DSM 19980 TaxID=1121942 RepID=A0A1M5DUK4_9GAMM|nr:NAD(P)/FAD-dependent oxidoreductase [Halomonas ilicicola]SHF70544.1 NADPH-dependent 2,4-dienoyl-CoA reductase, sulfur reductase [Halomonas ilicicola DSM 19980]
MMAESRNADIAIVGAGPAGMAAAVTLADAGYRPTVFDMNAAPGGQIYRQLHAPQASDAVMGKDYRRGRELLDAFLQADIDHRPGSRVWWADNDASGTALGVLARGQTQRWQARQLILAGGAMERGWPFRGWQLPGVMNAGAAQILLKQGALVPSIPPVLAGSGPLLYLLAWQYLRAARPPALILDVAPARRYGEVLHQVHRAWLGRDYLLKGARLIGALKRAGVPIRQGITALEAEGDTAVERVRYRHKGRWHTQPSELLLTHFGVTPEPQLARSLGLEHVWHAGQQCFVPRRDATLAAGTNLWIAGDGGGIGGALNAEREGRLVALSLLENEQRTTAEQRREGQALLAARRRDLEARCLLERLFRLPESWLDDQSAETLVCRCESVSRGELDLAITQGGAGPNQLKAFTRCGMGPCQGRQCGESVTRLLAQRLGGTPDAVGYYHIRPPVHSITLGELAAREASRA